MTESYLFNKVEDLTQLEPLKKEWRKSLTAPQDGMWEALTAYAQHWEVKLEDQIIGYACVDANNRLLQFFILPSWLQDGVLLFDQFIKQEDIQSALVGTNNPVFLSLAMHFQKSVLVDTYLFSDGVDVPPMEREGLLGNAMEKDLERLVDFCHTSMGGPKDWLTGYLGDLIRKGELFVLEEGAEILGTCEVRKSQSNLDVADIGVIVSVNHRQKGLGTYLLGKAKSVAKDWGRAPICSCESTNIGSLKAIQANGFRTMHQMLLMGF